MLFILHAVPVAFSADSELVRNSVLLLPKTLDIQVVTRESELPFIWLAQALALTLLVWPV